MTEWTFVAAAYALVSVTVIGLIATSYLAMRKAEADAETAKRRR